ncbi:MAG: germination protein YpeB [Oscillospiraceae bacterium]|nr:germination protein YpeB [Oscillospiraceae bacterium]
MGQKRVAILLVAINLTVLTALGILLYQKHQHLTQYSAQYQATEQQTAEGLRESMAEIEALLNQGRFTTSHATAASVGIRMYGRAAEAAMALAKLPVPPETAAPKRQFLGEVSILARRMVQDGPAAFESAVPVFAAPMRSAIPVEDALDRVAAFMDVSPVIFSHTDSEYTHRFRARVDGGELIVAVDKTTGQVTYAMNSRRVSRIQKSPEEGLALAQAAVLRSGHANMESRYHAVRDNTVVADFFYTRDGVVFYPDHVRVSVGLDNGRVTGFTAAERLYYAHPRTIPAPAISPEGAMDAVPAELAIEGYDLAVIEVYGAELLCYAFHCRAENGQAFFVYVSADTGQQLEIRLLRKDTV